jgi:Ras-related protein Rab-1A
VITRLYFRTLSIDGKLAKLQIWDTAGQERFRNIVRSFYKDTQGVVIVFDAQEVDGLEKV